MVSQVVKIVDDGTLMIPAQFRQTLGLKSGDTVVIELAEDGFNVRSLPAAVHVAQSIVREFSSDARSLADELTAERKAEAARE